MNQNKYSDRILGYIKIINNNVDLMNIFGRGKCFGHRGFHYITSHRRATMFSLIVALYPSMWSKE